MYIALDTITAAMIDHNKIMTIYRIVFNKITLISFFMYFFFLQMASATDPLQKFIINLDNGDSLDCDSISIGTDKISCIQNQIKLIYNSVLISSIQYKNTKVDLENKKNHLELVELINLANDQKEEHLAQQRRQEIDKFRKIEELKQQKKYRYRTAQALCERECEVTKYSYDRICFQGCMSANYYSE